MARTALLLALLLARRLAAAPDEDVLARLLEGAERQVGVTVVYDGSYRRLSYPGGDVPLDRGVCTDVVIRAYRHAGIDLQVLVHEDLRRAFAASPRGRGASRPDRNIDHRRVPNLATFFARHGTVLPVSREAGDYRPGEVVTWRLASGLPHIGIVSARVAEGRPLVIHNVGAGTVFEDFLFANPVTGRYRYPADAPGIGSPRGPDPRRGAGSAGRVGCPRDAADVTSSAPRPARTRRRRDPSPSFEGARRRPRPTA